MAFTASVRRAWRGSSPILSEADQERCQKALAPTDRPRMNIMARAANAGWLQSRSHSHVPCAREGGTLHSGHFLLVPT